MHGTMNIKLTEEMSISHILFRLRVFEMHQFRLSPVIAIPVQRLWLIIA